MMRIVKVKVNTCDRDENGESLTNQESEYKAMRKVKVNKLGKWIQGGVESETEQMRKLKTK